jgi:transposase
MEWKPGCCDDLIPQGHQARLIWDVVGKLDVSAFCEPIKARDGVCGRDANDPRLMISLWLYASTRGVGSARELNRLCAESKPYQWLCGGVSMNYHSLGDFRVGHARALDELLKEAKAHVEELSKLLNDPEQSAGLSAKKKAARKRAARERVERIEAAVGQLPKIKEKQKKAADQAGNGEYGQKLKKGQPRVSTTDADARVMKMSNGGFNPAINVQLAVDTDSRAIVGVEVTNAGSDKGLSEPMREQVEDRSGQKVQEHLMDGGYLVMEEIDHAVTDGVRLFVPPTKPRDPKKLDQRYVAKPTDSEAQARWREMMGTQRAKTIYKERASTIETANADLKTHRGLEQFRVRGMSKVRSVAIWCALAFNLFHWGGAMMG